MKKWKKERKKVLSVQNGLLIDLNITKRAMTFTNLQLILDCVTKTYHRMFFLIKLFHNMFNYSNSCSWLLIKDKCLIMDLYSCEILWMWMRRPTFISSKSCWISWHGNSRNSHVRKYTMTLQTINWSTFIANLPNGILRRIRLIPMRKIHHVTPMVNGRRKCRYLVS